MSDIDGATHVLHWGPWCGGTWRDTDGLWELLTREDFDAGREFIQDRGDWYATGSRKADPEQLTGWVAGLLGCPATLAYCPRLVKPRGLGLPHTEPVYYVTPEG